MGNTPSVLEGSKCSNTSIPLEINDNIKGIPEWSGRVRHTKSFLSKSYIFLLPTFWGHQPCLVVLYCFLFLLAFVQIFLKRSLSRNAHGFTQQTGGF